MKILFSRKNHWKGIAAALLSTAFFSAACDPNAVNPANQSNTAQTNAAPLQTPTATPSATPNPAAQQMALNLPVTLPVIDAMFSDETFANDFKAKMQLPADQIEQLKKVAREATANLEEKEDDFAGSTSSAIKNAEAEIRRIFGDQKAPEVADFIRERWQNGTEQANAQNSGANSSNDGKINAVPSDSRIVVNAPAYRMDVFKDGKIVKSYKIGIGYPEFPLPSGTRTASTIIFNPTWTPPDEPWVKGKIKAGETVKAGSSMNPLGPIKIPIGLPSLIHGGKQAARLGGFASHGCVGLTNAQVQDFALTLADATETNLTAEQIKGFEKDKTKTENFKLSKSMPVELRYETIIVEDGQLKIFRDVYERSTNTEENLRKVLDNYGVSFDSLTEKERIDILDALKMMARDAGGQAVNEVSANSNANAANSGATAGANTANAKANAANGNAGASVTRSIKGKKEMAFKLAQLQGKGYPAPVSLNAGK